MLEKYAGNIDPLIAVRFEGNMYICESCKVNMTLMLAALNSHVDCIRYLVDQPQNELSVRNLDGTTAIHVGSIGPTLSLLGGVVSL